ncbi:MAG: FAD-dependent oxidoreductase [Actinomycetales bacterium]|nr:FAD-dependent oxidoreductase [Candidatus Phosphoribacter baldrii]
MSTVAVVGGGIVGLATARALARVGMRLCSSRRRRPLAQHQTGRNSGSSTPGSTTRRAASKPGWPSPGPRRCMPTPARKASPTTTAASSSWPAMHPSCPA